MTAKQVEQMVSGPGRNVEVFYGSNGVVANIFKHGTVPVGQAESPGPAAVIKVRSLDAAGANRAATSA
jgi:hypothetical protein